MLNMCNDNPSLTSPWLSSETHYHGAILHSDGTTCFSLWAPDADTVEVRFFNGEVYPLKKLEKGWFSAVIFCQEGTFYKFTINNQIDVPDPASRQQNDVYGYSCVVNQSYPWKNNSWKGLPWHHTILYELHVGTLGGFRAVEQYLPHLKRLGVTAVELMPIGEFSGTRNWGYDGVFPFAPESSYGTPKDFKRLVDTAHSLGLMVFLDVVYNHFGSEGNHLDKYASEFFCDDKPTPWGPVTNFQLPEVRHFFYENALMWINDYRIDGLRIDAADAIKEKDFLIELSRRVRQSVHPERHVHLVLENDDNSAWLIEQGFDAQWNEDGHHILHHLLTGEERSYYSIYVESATEKLARCLREGFIFQGELGYGGKPRGESSGHLSPTSFVMFLQNHDQIGNRCFGNRLTTLANTDALKVATVVLLLSPMIPLLFMGEEWGETRPFFYFTDFHDELAKKIWEGRFKEFPDAYPEERIPNPNDGHTFQKSRIEIPIKLYEINSNTEMTKQQHWWRFYKELLHIRHQELVQHLPNAYSLGVDILADKAVCAKWQMGNGSHLYMYINLSESDVTRAVDGFNPRVLFRQGLSLDDYESHLLPSFSALVTLNENT